MLAFITDVPTFLQVVESGSFAAAGKRLNVSRSAIGKSIFRLEQRLGTRLFHRTTRSQSLTPEGRVFLESCQRAMAEFDTAKRLIDAGAVGVSGRLRISMPVLFGRLRVVPVLMQLARTHPGLELVLEFTDHYVDVIREGLDLCVRADSLEDVAGVMARRLVEKSMIVCASPDYVARRGRPDDLEDLARHELIAYSRAGRTQLWRFPAGKGRTTDVTPVSRLSLDDLGSILDATLYGEGLAWLPDWLVSEHLDSGRLVRLFPDLPALRSTVQLVWPETPYLARRVRVAIDALVEAGRRGWPVNNNR